MARRGAKRGIEWERVWRWMLEQRDRVIIFSLMGVIVALFAYIYMVTVRDTLEQRLEQRLPPEKGRVNIEAGDLEKIVGSYRQLGLEEAYGDVISQNMFESAAERRKRLQRISRNYEAGRAAAREEKLDQARESLQAVLRDDPFERMIDYPELPSNLLKRVDIGITCRQVRENHENWGRITEQAREADKAGNPDLALSRFREAIQIYEEIGRLDPERTCLDQQVFEGIARDQEQVLLRYREILRLRLLNLVRENVAKAREMLSSVEADADLVAKAEKLGDARELLQKTKAEVSGGDPKGEFVPAEDRTTLDEVNGLVTAKVDEVVPALRQDLDTTVPALNESATNDQIQRIKRTLTVLAELAPNVDQTAWQDRFRRLSASREQALKLARMQTLYTEAQQLEQRNRTCKGAREPDYECMNVIQGRVREIRAEIDPYFRDPDQVVSQSARNIDNLLQSIEPPPPRLTGYHFIALDRSTRTPKVTLCDERTGLAMPMFVGLRSGGNLFVHELAADGSWVIVRSRTPGEFQPTRLEFEPQYKCGGG